MTCRDRACATVVDNQSAASLLGDPTQPSGVHVVQIFTTSIAATGTASSDSALSTDRFAAYWT